MKNVSDTHDGGSSTCPTGQSLRYGTTRAAITSGTAQIVTRVLTIVLSVATARALEPREVGTLGLAVIIVGVISMIGYYPETAGVAAPAHDGHGKSALASVAVKAMVLAFLFVSLSLTFPLLAQYLTGKEAGGKSLRELLVVLWWVPLLELLGAYPRVLLQRRLELNWIAAAGLMQSFVFVGLAVVLLWTGYGYLGVAWANVISAVASTPLLWVVLWLRGGFGWQGWPSKDAMRETLTASIRVFVGGFGGFLGERMDNLLVAGSIGPTAMSFYSMAWNASRTPANVFGSTIGFVMIPTLARIQDEPVRIQRAIRESLRHSYLLLLPICAFIFVSAPLLVSLVLGAKWLPLVPCLRVMCFTVLVIPVLFASGALLTGSGRAHLTGIAMLIHLIMLFAAIPPLAREWGIVGAAYGDLLAMSTSTAALFLTARIATRQTKWSLSTTLLVPIAAAVISTFLAWATASNVRFGFLQLVIAAGVLLVAYPVFVGLLGGKGRLTELTALVSEITSRRGVPLRAQPKVAASKSLPAEVS